MPVSLVFRLVFTFPLPPLHEYLFFFFFFSSPNPVSLACELQLESLFDGVSRKTSSFPPLLPPIAKDRLSGVGFFFWWVGLVVFFFFGGVFVGGVGFFLFFCFLGNVSLFRRKSQFLCFFQDQFFSFPPPNRSSPPTKNGKMLPVGVVPPSPYQPFISLLDRLSVAGNAPFNYLRTFPQPSLPRTVPLPTLTVFLYKVWRSSQS